MAKRKAGDWISAYLEYTENTEPPISYHVWTGISTIAAALQRKVWMSWGHETIYPNMYVVLIGASGRTRKGTAMNIGKALLREIKEIKITSESITREALIRLMKNSVTNMSDPRNPSQIKMHCSITVISEELSVFLGQHDIKFLSTLTDWYDSRERWTYETKGSGKDSIEGVCVNLLGATAPDWLQSILPEEAIGGGFTSRIIFVVEDKKGKTIPNPSLSKSELEMQKSLIHDLEQIVLLKGGMDFTPEARETYENWYEEQDVRASRGIFPVPDPRFTGYCERRPTHIKKLAMILSASRSNSRMIDVEDFERAKIVLEDVERKMPRTFGGLGSSDYGQMTEKVLRYLEQNKEVLRSTLMRQFYRDVDPATLEIIQRTLEQMKVIDVIILPREGDVRYKYTGP